jgi:prefoldin subunit 2
MSSSQQHQQVASEYSARAQEVAQVLKQVHALEQELGEHQLVISTLAQAQPNRRCAMLVGSVLCQRTVEAVLPKVRENQDRIAKAIEKLTAELKDKEQALGMFKQQHNIRS